MWHSREYTLGDEEDEEPPLPPPQARSREKEGSRVRELRGRTHHISSDIHRLSQGSRRMKDVQPAVGPC
jgi:hypothetical protein